MSRQRCAKRVFSGARHDMTGHMCGRYALPESEFCRLHGPAADRPDLTADATAPPTVEGSVQVRRYSSLTWKPGEGPVVPIPYRQDGAYGFITKAYAAKVARKKASVSVRGVIRKSDGTPGQVHWDASYRAEDLLPAHHLEALLAALPPVPPT